MSFNALNAHACGDSPVAAGVVSVQVWVSSFTGYGATGRHGCTVCSERAAACCCKSIKPSMCCIILCKIMAALRGTVTVYACHSEVTVSQ